jgi:hypothetical protein
MLSRKSVIAIAALCAAASVNAAESNWMSSFSETIPDGTTVITTEAFKGQSSITSVTIPASVTDFRDVYTTSVNGAAAEGTYSLTSAIKSGFSWSVKAQVTDNTTDGSYNTWGSSLLATGSSPLESTYDGGIQFYYTKAKKLLFKIGYNETTVTEKINSTSFTLEIAYEAASSALTIKLTDGNDVITKTATTTFNDFSTFSWALPTDINITSMEISATTTANPFSGCTKLASIELAEGNTAFTLIDGALYTADGSRMVAYPENRWLTRYFRIASTDGKYGYINPLNNADDSNRRVLFGDIYANNATTLWQMVENDGKVRLQHAATGRLFGGKDGSHSRIEAVANAEWSGSYGYSSWIESVEDEQKMAVQLVLSDQYYVYNGEPAVSFSGSGNYPDTECLLLSEDKSAAATFYIEEATVIPVKLNVDEPTPLCLPVAVKAPAAPLAFVVTGVVDGQLVLAEYSEGETIPAKTAFFLGAGNFGESIDLEIVYAAANARAIGTNTADNLLSGTSYQTSVEAGSYIFNAAGMTKVTESTIVSSGASYISATTATEKSISDDTLSFDADYVATGIEEVSAAAATDSSAAIFDMQGRRVASAARPGFYIQGGRKFIVR